MSRLFRKGLSEVGGVVLSAAKNLSPGNERFFATLRMTGEIVAFQPTYPCKPRGSPSNQISMKRKEDSKREIKEAVITLVEENDMIRIRGVILDVDGTLVDSNDELKGVYYAAVLQADSIYCTQV